mgnify:FL=1
MASQMQSVFMNGFCPQPADMLRNANRSPTNLSENSDRDPSSPEIAMSMHPALPGQVSFYKRTLSLEAIHTLPLFLRIQKQYLDPKNALLLPTICIAPKNSLANN